MRIDIVLPHTEARTLETPHCPYCKSAQTRISQRITKRVKDPALSLALLTRRRCKSCGRTFRHYPTGVGRNAQTHRVRALTVLLYCIGLSYSQIVSVLGECGVNIVKSTVWRNVKTVGRDAAYIHQQSVQGKVKIMHAPTKSQSWWRTPTLVRLVERMLSGEPFEVELPEGEEGKSLAEAFAQVTARTDTSVTIHRDAPVTAHRTTSDDVRKGRRALRLRNSMRRRARELMEEARELIDLASAEDTTKLRDLLQDCAWILNILEREQADGEKELWELYSKYAAAKGPQKGEKASIWYKMRLFTLGLWDKWVKTLELTKH